MTPPTPPRIRSAFATGRRLVRVCATAGLAFSTAAVADPVTYEGTVGGRPVVVELTADPGSATGEVAGRFFYRSEGIDIPLNFGGRGGGRLELVEEEVCSRERCPEDVAAPRGAVWSLAWHHADAALKGSARGDRNLPVVLHYVAGRKAGAGEAATPLGLFESSESLVHLDTIIDARSHPYDYARLNEELATVDTIDLGGARFAYVADRRAPLAYPRLAALPGGQPTDAANALLNQRHWRWNLGAFTCMALRHVGFHADRGYWGSGFGSSGGYDEITVEVGQLTARMMSWTESGSLMCGGMSPSNFRSSHVMDVERGEMLEMADLFAGWTSSGPGDDLIDFVRMRRPQPEGFGIEHEQECGTDDLIATNLRARFERADDGGTLAVFGIYDLPTVINACADDLLTLPVSEIAGHLTPQAAALLPAGPAEIR